MGRYGEDLSQITDVLAILKRLGVPPVNQQGGDIFYLDPIPTAKGGAQVKCAVMW